MSNLTDSAIKFTEFVDISITPVLYMLISLGIAIGIAISIYRLFHPKEWNSGSKEYKIPSITYTEENENKPKTRKEFNEFWEKVKKEEEKQKL